MGVEGSGLPGQAVGYGTTSIEHGNQMASTLNPSFLPNAFTSTQPEQVAINDQPINA